MALAGIGHKVVVPAVPVRAWSLMIMCLYAYIQYKALLFCQLKAR